MLRVALLALLPCLLTVPGPAAADEVRLGWARTIGGTGVESATGVTVIDDHVYVVGRFTGTIDVDPGPGTVELTSEGSADIFVLKLDTIGRLVWARRVGGPGLDLALDLAATPDGKLVVTGGFSETVDFDPGAGVMELTSVWGRDAFVWLLDTEGQTVWAGALAGGVGTDDGHAVSTDGAGHLYVVGKTRGALDADPSPGVFELGEGLFAVELNRSGGFVWAGAVQSDGWHDDADVAVADDGSVYMVGWFTGTADLDPGPGTQAVTASCGDTFVLKLDISRDLLWARVTEGVPCDGDTAWETESGDVALDHHGNVITVGTFANEVDFDPGSGEFILDTGDPGDRWAYAWKLNPAGDLVWVVSAEGPGSSNGPAIAIDLQDDVHVSGGFSQTVDFDPGPGAFSLTSTGGWSSYVWRLNSSGEFVSAAAAARVGAQGSGSADALALDDCSNVYSAGYFYGSADFDPGAGTLILDSVNSGEDAFVWSLAQTERARMWFGRDLLFWCAPADSLSVDVVRGDLANLRASDGDFSQATDECVENDHGVPWLGYTDVPPPGPGSWFVIRPSWTGSNGSYDSDGPSQIEGRDDEIAASGLDCP